MAWAAAHPSAFETLRIPDDEGAPSFDIGFWPPREAERLAVLMSKMRKPARDIDNITDNAELIALCGLSFEVFRDMVRFGCRGWTGFKTAKGETIPSETEQVEIDGRKHTVLTNECLHILGVNKLTVAVGGKCMAFNMLSEAQKKTSAWRSDSPSSQSPTDAADATAPEPPQTTSTPSPESTDRPLKVAR